TSQKTFFDGNQNAFQGLLGLGGDGLLTQGTTSYLDEVAAAGVTDIQAFEMCDGNGGTMWLGGFDPAATAAAPQHTPMSAALPPLTLTFPGTSGTVTASAPATHSYLLDAGGGMWCIGMVDNAQLGVNITLMGDIGLRGFVTVFDRTKNRVGFAPEKGCAAH